MSYIEQPTPDDSIERFRRLTSHTDPRKKPQPYPASNDIPERAGDPGKFNIAPVTSERSSTLVAILRLAGKRLLLGIVTIIAIIFLSFLGLDMARGSDFQSAVMMAVTSTFSYLGVLITGDLGQTAESSFSLFPVSIIEILPEIAIRSLGLLFASLSFAVLIGVPLGIWAAVRRNTPWALVTIVGSIAGISMPSYFAALLLQIGAIKLTHYFGQTVLPTGGFGWDLRLLFPAIVLSLRPLAQITRVTFISVSEVFTKEYIRTARSKGLGTRRVLIWHVLRNASLPILTTISLSLRFSLSGLPVVEFFFGWQGLGYHLLRSISSHDDDFTIAMLLCLGLLFILVNFLLDMSYFFIDPRLRTAHSQMMRSDRLSLFEWIQSAFSSVIGVVSDNSITRWVRRRINPQGLSLTGGVSKESEHSEYPQGDIAQAGRKRAWIKGTLGNPAFMIGGLITLVILFVIIFGASLSPHSPFTTQGLEYEDGEFTKPPFSPDETYPWGTDLLGRDMMSLILTGAQQTFVLVTLAVAARLVVGFVLGAAAGWRQDSLLDRVLLRLVEIISAFPTMLFAMILILALNIRTGMMPFVIALCVVGWGEIMQFVRGETMRIRPALFIESSVASGARVSRIILSHVLPNLLPLLISIAVLEMGAVLLLLGELGFVGIFIGGGAFREMEWMTFLFHYSDVPEWGALLSNVRTYVRSYPWLGIYPSLAFFVSILTLNVFGEGLRRLTDQVGVGIMRVFNRYTFGMGALAIVGFLFWRGSTGSLATYQIQANEFDGERAYVQAAALADPGVEGRALGSLGMEVAANYIATEFEALGLQAAGQKYTYFQTRNRGFQTIDSVPVLLIHDGGPGLTYHQDYNEFAGEHRIDGVASSGIRFVSFGGVLEFERMGYQYFDLPDLNFSGEILLVFEEDLPFLRSAPRAGTLIIASEPVVLQRRYTIPNDEEYWMNSKWNRGQEVDSPTYWVSEATADRLLSRMGKTTSDLLQEKVDMGMGDIFDAPLGVKATMQVEGQTHKMVPVFHVIGHLPGVLSNQFAGIDDRLIMVLAQYDCPPTHADGEFHACANDNSSGVAVMLETIRTMQESGYQPYKTFLFIAYSGEGYEGGLPVSSGDVKRFLDATYGFSSAYEIEAVVELRGLGASDGNDLLLASDGSLRLAQLFQSVSRRLGVPAQIIREEIDLSLIFSAGSPLDSGEEAPRVRVYREGWDITSHTVADQLESISVESLEDAGRVISLSLMIIGREIDY
ncbi:MAG: ABC transporter permease subunit [Anaerolineales bacterium]|nr:ABC transporter permease subunit [Anaerolineales bacterium]